MNTQNQLDDKKNVVAGNPGESNSQKPDGDNNQDDKTLEEKKRLLQELEQQIATKTTQLSQLTDAVQDVTEQLRTFREELREVKNSVNTSTSDDDWLSDEDKKPSAPADIEKIVEQKLQEERKKMQQNYVQKALEKFIQENKDFDPSDSVGFLNNQKLKGLLETAKLEGSLEEIYDQIDTLANAIRIKTGTIKLNQENPDSKVVDSGIGDTTSTSSTHAESGKKAVTRKLSDIEQRLAQLYPGDESKGYPPGEEGYRMHLAEYEEG